jgi:SAM-dependent methyltransferase
MNISDIVHRASPALPWTEGDKIPWHEPGFSRRMLREHLSQEHDAASRRADIIDRQVTWIHEELLAGQPGRVLDICCGPGLYCERLARLGHACVGIDFGPASIEYATVHAEGLPCTYRHEDVRHAQFGTGFDLALLIHGEFNAFAPAESDAILRKAHAALRPDGALLLEVNAPATIESGTRRTWHSAEAGLFSDRPYLCLEEVARDADSRTESTRWYIIDADTGDVTKHAQTIRLCSRGQYDEQIRAAGFATVEFLQPLGGAQVGHYVTIVARKQECGG